MVRIKAQPIRIVPGKPTRRRNEHRTNERTTRGVTGQLAPAARIPRCTFQLIMKELVANYNQRSGTNFTYQSVAIHATQQAAEQFLSDLFMEAATVASIRGSRIIERRDILIAQRMRPDLNPSV